MSEPNETSKLWAFCKHLYKLADTGKINRFWMQHTLSGSTVSLTVFGHSELTIYVGDYNEPPSEFHLTTDGKDITLWWYGTTGPEGQDEFRVSAPVFRQLVERLQKDCDRGVIPPYVLNLLQQIGDEIGYRNLFVFINEPV